MLRKYTTLYEARNLAIKKSKGKFVAKNLDVDDVWLVINLNYKYHILKKKIWLVYSNFYKLLNNKMIKLFLFNYLPSGKVTAKIIKNYQTIFFCCNFKKSFFK